MWKKINDKYSISNEGSVRNDVTDYILKGELNSKGYLRVVLHGKKYSIHRLVAIAFIPNPDNKPQVNHIDGNKLNNNDWNLNWMNNQENNQHSFDNGRISHRTKISNNDLLYIIECLKDKKYTTKQLANMYNVSYLTIHAIKQGRNQKRLKFM